MTYQLQLNGEPVGGNSFESWFLHISFKVTKKSRVVQLASGAETGNSKCYFAYYSTGTSGYRNVAMPQFGENPKEVQTKDFHLVDTAADRTLQLNSLSLVESRCTDMSNEFSQLSLFEFINTSGTGPDSWLNDGSWGSDTHVQRDRNERESDPFIPHLLTFDNCAERDCYWMMTRDTQLGLQRVATAMPFDQGSFSANLLQHIGSRNQMPELEIKVNDNPWKTFNEDPHPEETTGVVMVCAGAFREMSMGREVESFRALPSSGTDLMDLLSEFSERRQRYNYGRGEDLGGRQKAFQRSLQNIEITREDSTVETDARDPIEVVFLDFGRLHKVQPIDMFA